MVSPPWLLSSRFQEFRPSDHHISFNRLYDSQLLPYRLPYDKLALSPHLYSSPKQFFIERMGSKRALWKPWEDAGEAGGPQKRLRTSPAPRKKPPVQFPLGSPLPSAYSPEPSQQPLLPLTLNPIVAAILSGAPGLPLNRCALCAVTFRSPSHPRPQKGREGVSSHRLTSELVQHMRSRHGSAGGTEAHEDDSDSD